MTTFSRILREHYQQRPHQTAIHLVQSGHPDRAITYTDLIHGAAGWSAALHTAGVQPGGVVVLILRHGLDLIESYFGVILSGAVPSIMPFLTEKLLPERYRADLAALAAVTQPQAVITYAEFEPEVRAALGPDSPVRVLLTTASAGPQPPDWDALGGLQRAEDDIVLLQHSSGTTGLQKGVALSHQAVANQLEHYAKALRLHPDDVIVSWLPLYHDMGLIAGFLQPILGGIPLVLMSPFEWVRAPGRLMQLVSQYRGTLTWLPNFAYNFCAHKVRPRELEGVDLSSWRAVINCSEPMRAESHEAFLARFTPYGLRPSALATCYAMAENVFAVTQGGIDSPVVVDAIDRDALQTERIARPADPASPSALRMPSAGKPIEGTEVRVLTAEGQDAPERVVGEIALRSDCMLTGYYHRPDVTQQAFLDGWYLTGDFGYHAGGELYVSGRKKDMIIVGGKNVYPQDLEELAMSVSGVHPGRVVAFGVFDDESGTEEVVIAAELDEYDQIDEAGRDAIADEIRATVTRGSAVALHYVHLTRPGWIVKTSSGKTARGANREKWQHEMAGPEG